VRALYLASRPSVAPELTEAELRDVYRHPRPRGRAVWLRSNFVTSLDGSIQGVDGRSGSINTPSDQHVFALHRAHADAVLVGAQTARAEGYRAVDLAPWQRELRTREGLSPYPLLAVVTRSLDLDPSIATPSTGDGGPVAVFTTAGKSPAALAPFTAAGIDVVQLSGNDPDAGVDLPAMVARLADVGCVRVLCEGGPRLHRDLLAADLVDELSLTLAPVTVGGTGSRTTTGAPLPDSPGFALSSAVHAHDGTLLLRYSRVGREQR
jgi:riboflavin biosynthesis pyrimidine reductase